MFWVHDSLVEDFPGDTFPYGKDTVGIVDDRAGGIILYTHKDSAKMILDALEGAL